MTRKPNLLCILFYSILAFSYVSACLVVSLPEAEAATYKKPPPKKVVKKTTTKPVQTKKQTTKAPTKKQTNTRKSTSVKNQGVSNLSKENIASKSKSAKTSNAGRNQLDHGTGVSGIRKSSSTRRNTTTNSTVKPSKATQAKLDTLKQKAKYDFNSTAPQPYKRGFVRTFKTTEKGVYYRVYSGNSTKGGWLVKVPPKNSSHAQQILNLPPWNKATMIQKVYVPEGIELERSRALGGGLYGKRGGGEQFRILPGQNNKGIIFDKGKPLK